MTEQSPAPVEPAVAINREDRGLPKDLEQSHEEILRLRDVLISKDIELGALRGRITELEQHSARLAVLAQHLQLRIPGAARLVGGLRLLARRRGQEGG